MAWHDRGGEDRRAQGRFEIVGELWGSLETIQPLALRNLGRGGALLESPVPLPTNVVRRLRLRFQSHVSEVRVQVRHVKAIAGPGRTDRYLIGVEFEGLLGSTIEQIDELVGRSDPHAPSPGTSR